jgi:hypothetical protein
VRGGDACVVVNRCWLTARSAKSHDPTRRNGRGPRLLAREPARVVPGPSLHAVARFGIPGLRAGKKRVLWIPSSISHTAVPDPRSMKGVV